MITRRSSSLLLLFVWGGYAIFRANYALFTVCITGYIVVLMHLAGTATPTVATYRAVDTVLGGALALLVYSPARTRGREDATRAICSRS